MTVDEHYYCAGEFHRCADGGGAGEARRYNPELRPELMPSAWIAFVGDRWDRISWLRFVPDVRFGIYGAR